MKDEAAEMKNLGGFFKAKSPSFSRTRRFVYLTVT